MSLDLSHIKRTAELARVSLSDTEAEALVPSLTRIMNLVEQMSAVDTSSVEPLIHPNDHLKQPMRPDVIAEVNQRDKYLKLAPQTEAGLYLVPTVIE
jgi:aspartyl-tRNA(Asn)/glutamyl-tRNA(Gln) amidotransferase subunit C